ncbi:acetyltransferase [Flavihumibacter sp. R14]|nr:acetyltransferase [Flavihumibacter soli]
MKKQKLILIGGGGHCKSCIDVLECLEEYEIVGILDRQELAGTKILDYSIVGTDNDILKYKEEGCHFLITVGQIKSVAIRKKIFHLLEQHQAQLATVISPNAHISKYAKIGKGTIVMHGVIINAAVIIGDNCILNTGCSLEHDVVVGNYTHISTHAIVNGGCVIGSDTFVGSNTTISNNIVVGNEVVLGAGAVVTKNIYEPGIYIGHPAKRR